ncbi:hypothetical protein SteCoe_15290 [Stentor coeruleus]|uniref:EF-hand domain-containing protein n=1 Tax=Stentor coeruleus TaxID=5963 RepID=A0A1R2C3Z0_9CILI|nr:hypothetical protein SteCoe_15290 [Stentor coeruleus]
MLSIETESKLAEIFLQISHSEHSVEKCRNNLSSNANFDPYSTFKGVDNFGIGSFSSTEILTLMNKHNFFTSTDEAYLSIKQYNSNQNGRLNIDEFFSLVLPSTNPILKNKAISYRGCFTQEIEFLFVHLIQSEIIFHRNTENSKRALILCQDFTTHIGFRTIDLKNNGFIDRRSLQGFLCRYRSTNEEDIDAIFRRLDNDGDDVLNYQEFAEAIMPSQTSVIRGYRKIIDLDSYAQIDRLYQNATSRISYRKSSPLRNLNLKESMSSGCLQKSFADSSPFVYALSTKSNYRDLRSAEQPLRNFSPLRSSPLQSSRGPTGYYYDSGYKTSSPLRATNLINTNRIYTPYRASSPITQTNPTINNQNHHLNLNLPSSNSNDTQNTSNRKSTTEHSNHNSSKTKNSSRKSSPNRISKTSLSNHNTSKTKNSSKSKTSANKVSIEEKELVNWFKEEIKISRNIETMKNELAFKHDFNLIDAFRMFDTHNYGSITLADFEATFHSLSFNAAKEDLYLLIKHFSHLQNNRINLADFSVIFLPKQEEYAYILKNRLSSNPSVNRFHVFSNETIELFLSIFRLVLDFESLAERVRQRLSRIPNFSFHQAFITIDKDRNGYITIDEFQLLLQNHGIIATSKDLQNLLHIYDKNRDGKISYNEFVKEVTPKSPRRY